MYNKRHSASATVHLETVSRHLQDSYAEPLPLPCDGLPPQPFEKSATKKMIQDYFGDIPAGSPVERVNIIEDAVEAKKVTEYDSNIQIPIKLFIFRTPSSHDKDAYALDMVSSILTSGKSSRMYKKLVEEKKALQVLAFNDSQEDYGTYIMGALPMGETSLDDLIRQENGLTYGVQFYMQMVSYKPFASFVCDVTAGNEDKLIKLFILMVILLEWKQLVLE